MNIDVISNQARTERRTAAAVLIGNCGRVLCQARDDIPNILYPGQIGLFGGHIEAGESPIEAVTREISEETGFLADEKAFQYLCSVVVPLQNGTFLSETVFWVKGVNTDALTITEGTLAPIRVEELPQQFGRMTPATCCALRLLQDLKLV